MARKVRIQFDLTRNEDIDRFLSFKKDTMEQDTVLMRQIVREYFDKVNVRYNKK